MDTVTVKCTCGKQLKFSSKFIGKSGICTQCGSKILIEDTSSTPPPSSNSGASSERMNSPSFGRGETTPLPIKKAKKIIEEAKRKAGEDEGIDEDWDISTYFGKGKS